MAQAKSTDGMREVFETVPAVGTVIGVWTENYALRLFVEETAGADEGPVVDDEVAIIGEGRGFETDADHGKTTLEVEETADGFDAWVSYYYPDRSGAKRDIPVERVEVGL